MKQILIQRVGDIFLSVDLSGVGKEAQSLPTQQHKSWQELEQYLLSQGAKPEQLKWVREKLETTINVIVTV